MSEIEKALYAPPTEPSAAMSIGEGKLVNATVRLADGSVFDLGRPGTWRHNRRLRKYVRTRMKNEPAFREAFGNDYSKRGRRLT